MALIRSDHDPSDAELIEAATSVLAANFDPIRHVVGAAILGRSGQVYAATHLGSARINVCAEEVALGMACSSGERAFKRVVAVAVDDHGAYRVVSPCGVCREVLWFYGRDIEVIAVIDDEIRRVRVADLLPGSWLDSVPWDPQNAAAGEQGLRTT